MNREKAAHILDGLAERLDIQDIKDWRDAVDALLLGAAALLGPRPDPETGLVPCGCGGKAAVKKGVNHRSGYYVICEKCECNIGFDRDDYLRPYGAYPTEERAVSDWDTAMGYRG